MGSTFRGRFESKLDQKGRLLVPSGYRDTLKEPMTFVITNSQFQAQRCLDVYSLAGFRSLEKKIGSMSQLNQSVQAFRRFYLASAHFVTLDRHNRILIPQALRGYAGLEAEVQLVGMGEKFEIWQAAVWSQLFEKLAQGFEQTLANVADLEDGE